MSESKRAGTHDDGDIQLNFSANAHISDIIEQRNSRRQILGGMVAMAGLFGLSACDGDSDQPRSDATVSAGSSGATSSGKVVTLTGTATGSTGVLWQQVSGPAVTLTGANTNSATFIAPAVASATPLVFSFNAPGSNNIIASAQTTVTVNPAALTFSALPKLLNDVVTVPEGYTISVLYALGDPIAPGVPAFGNTGNDTNFAQRAGDHHDGMYFFGLNAAGTGRDDTSNTRGILCVNHENVTEQYLHANGTLTVVGGARTVQVEVDREIECHGVGIIEVARGSNGTWAYSQTSTFNRRITPNTPMAFNGPVRGAAQLRTLYSPTAVAGRGTVNNCANGFAPWGTYLTCEENWAGYFNRATGDNALRPAKEGQAYARYGVAGGPVAGLNWGTLAVSDPANTTYRKWNASVVAGPADGSGDFRNEPNQYGWIVEIDPYDPASTPRKRTAMGRMAHEGAWPANFVAGRPPVYYMGDDSRGEYFYKFVSATPWDAADAQRTDRLNVGDKYLDNGTLYVARFDATGAGVWIPLVFGTGVLTAANALYSFANQADVLINARLAADAVGATKMDRPEWASVNPANGEVYLTLTNGNATSRPLAGTDAANPRHYNDPRTNGTAQRGNPNGHIIRLRETGDNATALTFSWDIYLFGAGSDLDAANINLSGLDATNDFASPDGLWFGRPTNPSGQINPLLWIQTDDGSFTDVTNNQMLLALPGRVGDGGARTITNTDATGATRQQATIVGRAPGLTLKRFLVGPRNAEITGIDSTPDGRTVFVNIQHPGEGGPTATPSSNWPSNQNGAVSTARPRSATIVITKNDGGVVGL
ncbi:alkaline phosphatase PhoX [Brevundimonas sp.]|uniref:PhoX family protein n=1 Tax=Brevundimonas sp. TaxID=1871086 RepID=UPI00261E9E9D|nr:alkaline phosphatase PhoX [Brevundimonas sp.]